MNKLTTIKSVDYDVELGKMKKQPDLELLEKFCKQKEHHNMVITYEDKDECVRRRACLRAWLGNTDYETEIAMSVRDNKLYVIREENVDELSHH